jgi:hypothetical protein
MKDTIVLFVTVEAPFHMLGAVGAARRASIWILRLMASFKDPEALRCAANDRTLLRGHYA